MRAGIGAGKNQVTMAPVGDYGNGGVVLALTGRLGRENRSSGKPGEYGQNWYGQRNANYFHAHLTNSRRPSERRVTTLRFYCLVSPGY